MADVADPAETRKTIFCTIFIEICALSDIFVFICFLKVVETRHCQIQFVVDIFLNDFLLLIMCLSEVPF